MKGKGWIWLVGLIAAAAAVPAHADPRGQRLHRFLQERRQVQQDQRDLRRDPQQELPGRGRLTPEERRQLRRDIRDAGQDLYRRPPPPPPPPPYPPAGS